jgi:TPR repeat protein
MKSLSQELLLIFILTGIGSLVPFAVYGEDFTFSDLLKQGNQGDANAPYKLGDMYMYGEGVAKDEKEAFKWYRMAAEGGHSETQYMLGLMYQDGKGVVQDYKEAFTWYSLAASQKNDGAKYNRDIVLTKMSPNQIEVGQKLSQELYDKIYNQSK